MTKNKNHKQAPREHHYWRVIVTYSDGETSGNRVFKDREKADKWAERQRRSGVVKKVAVESVVRHPYRRRGAAQAGPTVGGRV